MGAYSEEMLQHMLQAGTGSPRFSGGWNQNSSGREVYCGSWDALVDMTSGGRGDICTRNGGLTGVIGWLWVDYGSNHSAPNSKLQLKDYQVWILRKSTNTWVLLWSAGVGAASCWNNSGNLGAAINGNYSVAIDEGGGIYTPNRSDLAQFSLEYWPTGGVDAGVRNAALVQDCKAVHIRCLVRVRLINPGSVDDRANARFRCRQGWDFANAAHPGHSGGNPVFGGDFTRPEKVGQAIAIGDYTRAYPGYAMDGGSGRWIEVPYSAGDPDRWYIISGSATQCAQVTGLYGAWAVAAGVQQYSGSTPYGRDEPFVLTPAQWRANPPPDPDIGGAAPPPPPPPTPAPITPGLPTKLRWFTKAPANKLQWGAHGAATSAPVFLTDTLPAASLGAAYSTRVQAVGSPAPTYSIVSGALPAGLSFNGTTGDITGTPTASGSFPITVRATGTGTTDKPFTLVVSAAPTWVTETLPEAAVGVAYSVTLAAVGQAPISFAIVNGALPPGLSIAGSTISGTPTTAGTFAIDVRANNPAGSTDETLVIVVTAKPLITTTSPLPAFRIGQPVSLGLQAVGQQPISWTVPLVQLPAGVSLSPLGLLSGTPTTAGSGSMSVTATNEVGSDTDALSWTVLGAGPVFSVGALPAGTAGVAYSTSVAATGAGTVTYSVQFTTTAGAAPTVSGAGLLSVPAQNAGTYSITVRATDSNGSTDQTFVLTVNPTQVTPTAVRTWIGPDGGGVSWQRSR